MFYLKNTYAELNDIERNRVNGYYNACIRRAKGFKSAQEDIDRLAPLISHINIVKIYNEEFKLEGF